jgi:alpha-L-fucosidase
MKKLILFCLLPGLFNSLFAQAPPKPYGALPNKAQLNWHEMEMYCIIHFGADTYTDKEWGYGDEDPAIVNPANFDALQIVGAAKAGGFKGIIVVAKHHDGLCLWPTKTTEHNISNSPWKNGQGDMVAEYRKACDKLNMQMGIYCSPWDRNSALYGSPAYVDLYRTQVKELYSNYGPLFISWHDGANGGDGYYGGKREMRKIDRSTYYRWDTTWALVRKLQPNAAIFGDVGPDVRWVGNEEGHAGETCWATYVPEAPDAGKKPGNGYSKYQLATTGTPNGATWMPAECDVPLRPGWFYHSTQDDKVKTPAQLMDLYFNSVGRGACLDLGLAPDRRGLLNEHDVASLKQFGDILRHTFALNLAKGAKFSASNIRGNNAGKYGPKFLTDDDRYSYWATDDTIMHPTLVAELGESQTFNIIRLRENIKLGQRITGFSVDAFVDGTWKEVAKATSIGANRLIRLPENVSTDKVRLRITGSGACVALSDFGLFEEAGVNTSGKVQNDLWDRKLNGAVKSVVTYHYNKMDHGKFVETGTYHSKTGYIYNRQGNTIRVDTYNTETDDVTSVGTLAYDKQGREVLYFNDGDTITRYEYHFNANKRLVEKDFWGKFKNPSIIVYNEKGQRDTLYQRNGDQGALYPAFVYHYDEPNKLKEDRYDIAGHLWGHEEYLYDDRHNLLEQRSVDGKGVPNYKVTYRYNERDDVVLQTDSNRLMIQGPAMPSARPGYDVHVFRYDDFDKEGNWHEMDEIINNKYTLTTKREIAYY